MLTSRAGDRHNATLLLKEFRRQLDEYGASTGKHYLLTNDIPGGNVNSSGSWELHQVAETVDWINVMTFDFHGSWDPITAFNSPFSLRSERAAGRQRGDPVDVEHRGIGRRTSCRTACRHGRSSSASRSTARSTSVSARTNHGLYQPHGAAPGNDSPTYHDLVDTGSPTRT